ncbi:MULTISPECIES: type IVB secretion system protein IcmH/DotU [unclassified Paraburkholderia]|uniref:type IVB secretion system protein IcmH/DotU n=1 Tax=unclassified Paraburkholderia TaxID=2615204 RepID=UPI000D052BBE|nr:MULTISPECIES: type IVB secretion system protein IcmH/DotU [unclassified Paraburkholderia]PRY06590.1 type VI secretion system protein ImpK [Paraburkholderia sp. BL25I1N1]REE21351.1 type VI secretion system protein ImpK [Paraburkholderia sp. BL27I4N3]REG49465.1 type VI secretion system protein ImpK [Paraburkholderia sp. BL6669N2]RKR38483.1 type VI secretion system protein ImpK [Paraburkholderia sp. BL17N1]TDY22313.1 type VI secretion system protein ImpK [Paraburkholderia sp. BL6665CI2N2]
MSYAPSLFGGSTPAAAPAPITEPSYQVRSLLDLLYDGFFMLFLLKNGREPGDAQEFSQRIQQFLGDFERGAKKLNASAEDVYASKFAFCAAIDESVLSSTFRIRTEWERRPLQLVLFGEQLAGEKFFQYLEECRAQGAARLQSLEVFHMCLLLGYQGKYLLEGPEKLAYLTARIGDEIAHLKGKRAQFAPHWPLPDQVAHRLKREVPLWSIGAVFALVGLLAYLGLNTYLRDQTLRSLAPYSQVVKLGPQSATLTISLP